jgi:hypothetical protein
LRDFPTIVRSIAPSVHAVLESKDGAKSGAKSRDILIDACVHEHARRLTRELYMIFDRQIAVVPMVYNVSTGRIVLCCPLSADPPSTKQD